jgi:hypothetical protein
LITGQNPASSKLVAEKLLHQLNTQSKMLNFELILRIWYSERQIEKLGILLQKGAKILLAYGGGSIFKNGIHEQINKGHEARWMKRRTKTA